MFLHLIYLGCVYFVFEQILNHGGETCMKYVIHGSLFLYLYYLSVHTLVAADGSYTVELQLVM